MSSKKCVFFEDLGMIIHESYGDQARWSLLSATLMILMNTIFYEQLILLTSGTMMLYLTIYGPQLTLRHCVYIFSIILAIYGIISAHCSDSPHC